MKKLSFLLIVLFMSIVVNAQTGQMQKIDIPQEHMKFMGIPIDGKIGAFSKNLKSKGFKQISKQPNMRLFEGLFSGKDAILSVSFDIKSKVVYRVMVSYEYTDLYLAKLNLEDFNDLIRKKYNITDSECREDTEYPAHINFVYNSVGMDVLGKIILTISKFHDTFYVTIAYVDEINQKKHNQSSMDDL